MNQEFIRRVNIGWFLPGVISLIELNYSKKRKIIILKLRQGVERPSNLLSSVITNFVPGLKRNYTNHKVNWIPTLFTGYKLRMEKTVTQA